MKKIHIGWCSAHLGKPYPDKAEPLPDSVEELSIDCLSRLHTKFPRNLRTFRAYMIQWCLHPSYFPESIRTIIIEHMDNQTPLTRTPKYLEEVSITVQNMETYLRTGMLHSHLKHLTIKCGQKVIFDNRTGINTVPRNWVNKDLFKDPPPGEEPGPAMRLFKRMDSKRLKDRTANYTRPLLWT